MISNVNDLLKSQGSDALRLFERVENGETQFFAVVKRGSKVYITDHVKEHTNQDVADMRLDALYEQIGMWCTDLKMSADEAVAVINGAAAKFGLKEPQVPSTIVVTRPVPQPSPVGLPYVGPTPVGTRETYVQPAPVVKPFSK